MAKKSSRSVIRSGAVLERDSGYLLACDPKREREEVPHATIIKWQAGNVVEGWANFDANRICIVATPSKAVVILAAQGEYLIKVLSGQSYAGNIFHKSRPPVKIQRCGVIHSLNRIAGKAYAVGLGGSVFRLDRFTEWTPIDGNLPTEFWGAAIDGFDASDIYAAGHSGELWHFDGKKWRRLPLPTNVHLESMKCADDGKVYLAGREGLLIQGRKDQWTILAEEAITDTIWDLEFFQGHLYASTMKRVYRLVDDDLEEVDFGKDPPKTCYHLSQADGVMWSIGGKDVLSFDGKTWTRII